MANWTIEQIVGAFALIMALGGGLRYILTPVIHYNNRQKLIDNKFSEIDFKLDNDNKRLLMLENDTKQILRAVNALLGHAIDNNHNGEVADAKKKLDEYLINR